MPISHFGRRTRRKLLAATFAGALVVTSFALANPATAEDDDVEHSKNVKPVANVPTQGDLKDDWHTDLAFWGDYAIQGSYGGFTIYDISKPRKPETVSQVHCPGGQGDVSVSEDGNLVFMSVDYPRTNETCVSEESTPAAPDSWEGMRVFDISDPSNPEHVTSVRTDCGSHTHTLVPDKAGESAYIYVSSYGPSEEFPNCQPPHDSISIMEVPLDTPEDASVIAQPVLFPDGGYPGTEGCHDITVFPEEDLAAGACMGEGILMDVSDPEEPYVLTNVADDNFAFYHSATFTNDTERVVFTDELGGGTAPTCNEEVGPEQGANAIYDIVGEGDDRDLDFRSYYKIPRHQEDTENCVAHNGSLIPTSKGDIMVQSWYQGGVSVYDFTDADNPEEIGYFDRGPVDDVLTTAGSWSAYWYNGYVYSSDITKGLDVLKVTGMGDANSVEQDFFNAQTQYRF